MPVVYNFLMLRWLADSTSQSSLSACFIATVMLFLVTIGSIALSWIILGLSSLGLGLLLRRPFRLGSLDLLGVCVAFWTGWAAIVALLQIWHLALPINRASLILILLLGGAGLLLEQRSLVNFACTLVYRTPALAVLLVVALLWLANQSTNPVPPWNGDRGLYYLQTVLWNSSYPIVPGLGNLHGRLAYNIAYFLYGALVDQVPFGIGAAYATDGLLVFALLVQSVASMAALALGARLVRFAFWNSLMLIPTLDIAFSISITPDIAVTILGLVLAGLYLTILLEANTLTSSEQKYLGFALTLLGCIGVTVKLSFLVLGISTLVAGLGVTIWRWRLNRQALLSILIPSLACALLVGGVWMARGIILSGYPLYPSTLGAFPVPWRIPTALVMSEANWIRSWARQPGVHWAVVLGNQQWLQPWLNSTPSRVIQLLHLTLISGLVGAVMLVGPHLSWRKIGLAVLWFLPVLFSLVFWFINAPDYRFASAVFWIVGLGSVLMVAERLVSYLKGELRPTAVRLTLVGLVLLFIAPLRTPLVFAPVPNTPSGVSPIPAPPYTTVTTASGLSVVSPAPVGEAYHCWKMPLPCTPYPRADLRQREPGNLAAGFVLDRSREYVDMTGSDLPPDVVAPVSLGVALVAGWHSYEPEYGARWMEDEGMILLYSEVPRRLRLTLNPYHILGSTGWVNQGQISVAVENVHLATVNVSVGKAVSLPLSIPAGFSRVTLRLAGGAHVPAEVFPGYEDWRRLSISLKKIELEDE